MIALFSIHVRNYLFIRSIPLNSIIDNGFYMKPDERQNEILAILRAMQKEFRVEELAEMLDVSELTIRRDLQQLTDDKSIIRTHGGCLAAGRASLETEYYEKVSLNFELKQQIGKAAAALVTTGETILINDGSTTYHLATCLGGKGPLTVCTNSLAMIGEISRHPDIRLSILGGDYNPGSYSISGNLTENMLELLHFDTVFIGVDAIDDRGRCMVGDPVVAGVAKAMLKSGTKKVLLADHTKVVSLSHIAYGTLRDFDLWITTQGMKKEVLNQYSEQTDILEATR